MDKQNKDPVIISTASVINPKPNRSQAEIERELEQEMRDRVYGFGESAEDFDMD